MISNILTKDSFKIIQITDTHVFAKDSTELFGINSNKNFITVLNKINKDELVNTDLIFLTGDISQDASFQSYFFILDSFKKISIPVIFIPGNHDDTEIMTKVLLKSPLFTNTQAIHLKHWSFILLNSKKDNSDSGYLSQQELKFLKNEIHRSNNYNIAIIMHHHPLKINTPLMDKYILENQQEFWNVIENTKVKLVICGHVHGDYSLIYQNITIETAPATCFQIKNGASNLEIEYKIGYKIYNFHQNEYQAKSVIWEVNE